MNKTDLQKKIWRITHLVLSGIGVCYLIFWLVSVLKANDYHSSLAFDKNAVQIDWANGIGEALSKIEMPFLFLLCLFPNTISMKYDYLGRLLNFTFLLFIPILFILDKIDNDLKMIKHFVDDVAIIVYRPEFLFVFAVKAMILIQVGSKIKKQMNHLEINLDSKNNPSELNQ